MAGLKLFVLSLLASATAAAALAEKEQYTIQVQRNAHAEASAGGSVAQPQDAPDKVDAAATGTEKSAVPGDEERRSSGSASAEVQLVRVDPTSVAANLSAQTYVNGGHSVTCALVSPLVGCIGRFGHDTKATATASAQWSATIEFGATARPIPYTLRISSKVKTSGAEFQISVKDPEGKELLPDRTGSAEVQIVGGPRRIYRIQASLRTSSVDQGGCCNAQTSGVAHVQASGVESVNASDVTASVTRSAILATEFAKGGFVRSETGEERRIVGGVVTTGYQMVGALLLDGKIHCTGTVIGGHTVLTAAHCLYNNAPERLVFVRGAEAYKPDSVVKVVGTAIPANDPAGFAYDDETLLDDIGLVYLEKPADTPMRAHAGIPRLADLASRGATLTFVGFGYDLVEGQKTGLGTKRQLDMPLRVPLLERRFRYGLPGKDTCNGDSGGPAFVNDGKKLYVAGVTSSGDGACVDHGTDTRLEFYGPWLKDKVR